MSMKRLLTEGTGRQAIRPEANPCSQARPLRVLFLHTSGVRGGAESLMLDLVRRLDRDRFAPELCCLKALGPVGEVLAREVPAYERLLAHKYDLRVLPRLTRLLRRRRVDAVICVGAGDKMFWGRLAARFARVPVVICWIHSTGWPDRIGWANRCLGPWTDMYVGVAQAHGRYLVEVERFPAAKVRVIANGVDIDRFRPRPVDAHLRARLGLPPGPLAGTVTRLAPEKNLEMLLDVAARTRRAVGDAQFLVIGDGPLRENLRERVRQLGVGDCVHFLGWRTDVAELLAALDAFLLTSHIEANPVSILEALASGVPVVSTRVGSVAETVTAAHGFLVAPGDAAGMAERLVYLLGTPGRAKAMGAAGRQAAIERWSLGPMVRKYECLIEEIYRRKRPGYGLARAPAPVRTAEDHCREQPIAAY